MDLSKFLTDDEDEPEDDPAATAIGDDDDNDNDDFLGQSNDKFSFMRYEQRHRTRNSRSKVFSSST